MPKDTPMKKEKEKEKLKGARHLEHVEVSAKGTIASGTWVAELDGADVRKNKLRS